jgi:glyoxylate/hydroxypyruvate reductase A
VSGWSNSPKQVDGIECFHGKAQLDAFLQRTDILVCLLPLTPDTRHILDRKLFAKLNRNSPMGAPVLINAGRGGLQNEADILKCLDDGTLGGVSLDVFATEPLPPDSPLWDEPNVLVSPHTAALNAAEDRLIAELFADNASRLLDGEELRNVVDTVDFY